LYPSRINRWQDTAAACDPFPNERNLHLSSYYTLEPFSFQGQTNTITTFLLLIDVSILRDHRRERVQGLHPKPRLEPTRWVILSTVPLERTRALRLSLDPCGARWYRTPDLIVFPQTEERRTLQLSVSIPGIAVSNSPRSTQRALVVSLQRRSEAYALAIKIRANIGGSLSHELGVTNSTRSAPRSRVKGRRRATRSSEVYAPDPN
jgi:hypothetical protein